MIFASLGENCLTDDILRRHDLKSFSTPFSPCRSNIDYALTLEKDNYKSLLVKENLVAEVVSGKTIVRSSVVIDCDNTYDPWHMKGFEFTHHDVLNCDHHRQSFQRKIDRLDSFRHKKDAVFFYHHRKNTKTDLETLRKKLKQFSMYYKSEINKVFMVLFYQTIVPDNESRRLDFHSHDSFILDFNFITNAMWGGRDPELFWAKSDDDLIKKMIEKTKSFVEASPETRVTIKQNSI